MQIEFTEEQQQLRNQAREWLAAHVPRQPLQSFDTAIGFEQHRQWERELHAGGWTSLTWGREFGGRAGDMFDWLIFEEEYWAAGAPGRVNQNGLLVLAPALLQFGNAAQRQRFLPRIAAGDDIWAQAWSEPGAGSDMAAICCSAELDGDHYVLNGQKSWVSRAVWADWLFGLFRTEEGSQRHVGLSCLLVPLNAAGVTVRPIMQLNGRTGMADVHFDNVKIPVEQRLGAEGEGWRVSAAISGSERGLMLRSPARFQETARALIKLYRQHQDSADADPTIRDAVLDCWMKARAYALSAYRSVSRLQQGIVVSAEASANKIFWSELDLKLHETAMRILGERAELLSEADSGSWLDGFMFAQAGTIYSGTNEIQRNIIAEQLLGMPR